MHRIRARFFRGPSNSFAALGLALTILFIPQGASSQTVLQYGDCVDSTLSVGETHTYEFEGSIGDVITVRMQDNSAAEPSIRVYDPTGTLLASETGSSSEQAFLGAVILPCSVQLVMSRRPATGDAGSGRSP